MVTYDDKGEIAVGEDLAQVLPGKSVLNIQFKSPESGTEERFLALVAASCPFLANTTFKRLTGSSAEKKLYEFGSTVLATCKPGYSFNQIDAQNTELVITCLTGGFWNVSQHCQKVICGDAPVVANGFVTRSSGVNYDSSANYKCMSGFLLNGPAIAMCQENGQWSTTPICSKVTCPAIPTTPHLTSDASDANNYNSVVNFSCDPGYTVDGSIKIFCGMDGKWSNPIPTCKEIKCVVPITSLYNTSDKAVPYQSVISFKCPKGFVIENMNKSTTGVTCNEGGNFDSPPKCEDYNECVVDPCKQNEVCTNTEGSHRCDCRTGFHRVNGVCTDIDECSTGMHLCEQICKNTEGSYQCDCKEGYMKHSVDITDLINNINVNNQMAVYCKKISCPTPMIPNTGNNMISPRHEYFYQDRVKYSCNFGYVVSGADTIICTSSGTWSYRPACKRATCKNIDATERNDVNMVSFEPQTNTIEFGDKVTIVCQGNVSRELICAYNRDKRVYELQGNTDKCPAPRCWPPILKNAVFASQPSTNVGSKFELVCEANYYVSGQSSQSDKFIRCQTNGLWDVGSLFCKEQRCRDPGTPGDSVQISSSYKLGSEVSYRCSKQGYTLTSTAPLKCVEINGVLLWDRTLPTCQDTEAPTISNCPTDPIYVDPLQQLTLPTLQVIDNSGIYQMLLPDNFNPSQVITKDETITITYKDFSGNQNSCVIQVKLRNRPQMKLTCPTDITMEEETTKLTLKDKIQGEHYVTLVVDPEEIIRDSKTIGKEILVKVHASNGTQTVNCSFYVHVKGKE
ncbi:CUB and sushi domain-containing protein 1-like [Octopus sinensis]|uniref:CUB and sushi domain-containing protein 1-like n=1 Tax=Octopus sinensis TaxID=2607531 RepID=A0A6P7U2B9_9MOLL|nr:CUB and sushi domain-containing protein 1-like [Octopus sinensis]